MMFVVADSLSDELVADMLTLPLLFLVLCCPTGFRRGEMDPDCDPNTPLLLEPRRRKS